MAKGWASMNGRKNYAREELDRGKDGVAEQRAAYTSLAEIVDALAGTTGAQRSMHSK